MILQDLYDDYGTPLPVAPNPFLLDFLLGTSRARVVVVGVFMYVRTRSKAIVENGRERTTYHSLICIL